MGMREFFDYLRLTVWRTRIKSCCGVAPLRVGLICLAYINAIVAIVQITATASGAALFQPMLAHVQGDLLEDDPSQATCVLPPATDLAFNAIFLAALYRRDVVLLRVYMCYGLASIFLAVMVYGLLEALINALYIFIIALNVFYQAYLLLLTRSLILEIKLEMANNKNEFIYNKDQGTVIIRDVESPTPAILPALPEPRMTTSITTLATLNEQAPSTPIDTRSNTLNRNGTLKTSTLKSYRTAQDVDVGQRSVTLPRNDNAGVYKPVYTQRVGAIQSLAGSSTLKPLASTENNTDIVKKETPASSVTVTATVHAADNNKSIDQIQSVKSDSVKSDVGTADIEEDKKTGDTPQKKKRGIFSRAPKEEGKSKKSVKNIVSKTDEIATTTPSESKNEIASSTSPVVTGTTSKDNKETINEVVSDNEEKTKNEEVPQKKKRGIFRKGPKEGEKKSEKKGKDKKGNESKTE